MTHVVTEACIECKYTDCVDVCPVDAFREGKNMLVIDSDKCIDCRLCISECPVNAIFADDDVPPDQQRFFQVCCRRSNTDPLGVSITSALTQVNADLAKRWPTTSHKKAPLPDAEQWARVKDKADMLDPQGARRDT